jgi:hypothetical protein
MRGMRAIVVGSARGPPLAPAAAGGAVARTCPPPPPRARARRAPLPRPFPPLDPRQPRLLSGERCGCGALTAQPDARARAGLGAAGYGLWAARAGCAGTGEASGCASRRGPGRPGCCPYRKQHHAHVLQAGSDAGCPRSGTEGAERVRTRAWAGWGRAGSAEGETGARPYAVGGSSPTRWSAARRSTAASRRRAWRSTWGAAQAARARARAGSMH